MFPLHPRRPSKKRSRMHTSQNAIDRLHLSGPTEALRQIHFTLAINVKENDATSLFNPESIHSIDAGPITRIVDSEHIDCTAEECNRVGFIGNSITLLCKRYTGDGRLATTTRRTYSSRKLKNYFTIAEVVAIIVRFERLERSKSTLTNDGRVDRDFVRFDGLFSRCDEHSFSVWWD